MIDKEVKLVDLSHIILYLQSSKNCTDKEVYQDINSSKLYQKYVQGLNKLPAQVFLQYLKRLNLTYDDLNTFKDLDNNELLYHSAIEARLNDDVERLDQIKKLCQKNKKDYRNDAYQHLEDIIYLWEQGYKEGLILIEYLLNVVRWSSYELRILYTIILLLPYPLANKLYKASQKRIKEYGKTYQHKKEEVWLDFYYVVACLQNKEWKMVEKMLSQLNNRLFSEAMLTERIIYLLLSDLYHIIKNPDSIEGHEALKQDLRLLKRLKCERLTSGILKLLVNLLEQNANEQDCEYIKFFPF